VWKENPISTTPIAHAIYDPHFGSSDVTNEIAYSGIYNWLYTLGLSMSDLYNLVIATELLAVTSILLALVHLIYLDSFLNYTSNRIDSWPLRLFCACFDLAGQRLNFHIGAMVGFFSIAWSAILLDVAIPASRGIERTAVSSHARYIEFYTGNWASYTSALDKDNHIFGSTYASPDTESLLTFFGGLKPDTMSLYLTDIAHHQLAVGILFVLGAHLYSSLYKGHLSVNGNSTKAIPLKSLHLQLSLACAGLAGVTSLTAQQLYSHGAYV
jgi:photosystem I P700 chlorophyll a apoprotein A2